MLFGDEALLLYFGFQAAFEIGQTFPTAYAAKLHTLHTLAAEMLVNHQYAISFFRLPL